MNNDSLLDLLPKHVTCWLWVNQYVFLLCNSVSNIIFENSWPVPTGAMNTDSGAFTDKITTFEYYNSGKQKYVSLVWTRNTRQARSIKVREYRTWNKQKDNPGKLATQSTQDEYNQSKNTTQYVYDITIANKHKWRK